MKKWSAHMLTGVKKMTSKMRLDNTCRTDVAGPSCRRGETCGTRRVARFAVVAMMMVLGFSGFVASAEAVTVSDNTATTASSTGSAWTNANNARSQSGTYATWKNTDQSYLVLRGFDFSSIPAGAQIDGITVTVRGMHSSTSAAYQQYQVGLTKNGSAVAGSLDTTGQFTQTLANYTHGGAANLWGTTWTDADVKNANFGVMLTDNDTTATGTTPGYSIDVMYITIDYSVVCSPDPAPTMNGGAFSGNPLDFCASVTEGATNTITNYEVTQPGPNLDDNFNDGTLDAKWTKTDVGPDATGAPVESGGTLTLSGGGTDVWGTADEFTYLHQQITGDFTMEVNVQSLNNVGGNAWHKSGLMARETLNGNSVNVNMMVTPGNGVTFENRPTTGATSVSQADAVGTAPKWIRIQRTGNSWRAWWSNNGTAWTENTGGAVNVTMPNTIYIGMAVTSHAQGTIDSAVFEDFIVTTAGSSVLYSGASCSGIDTTSWTDATYDLNVTYTDSCGATNQTTSGTFDFSTCSESTPSSIIWNGQNTAAGNFAGASFVNATDITGASMQYKVTDPGATTTGTCEVSATGDYYFSSMDYSTAGSTFNTSGTFLLSTTASTGSATGTPTEYDINFTSTGTYYVWVLNRVAGQSIWYGLDGVSVGSTEGTSANWEWRSANSNSNGPTPMEITVATTGVHQFSVWGRETNSETDGFILTQDPAFVPPTGSVTENSTGTASDIITPGAGCTVIAPEATVIDWTSDPISASGTLVNAKTYNLYARGNDTECSVAYYGDSVAQTSAEGTAQSFTWSSCNEQATVNVVDPGVISGTTPIVVTVGGSGGTNPQWSADGGTTWYNSGQSYTPPASCATAPITIMGRATGTCGTITDLTPVIGSYDTTDSGPAGDLAVLTVTPSGTVNGPQTIQVAVGTETAPASMTGMLLNISGSSSCDVTNVGMTWNGTSSRWEASWDNSACGTGAIESGITITASGTDPDCSDFVTGNSTVAVDNTCTDPGSTVSWTPPGGVVEAPLVVTATMTNAAYGAEVSFDDGTTWVANGSTFTPKSGQTGTINFRVRAFNGCDLRIYGGPYSIDWDGRTNDVKPVAVFPSQNGETSIRVLAQYSNDKNNDAEFTLRYKESTSGTWTTVGPVIDGQAGDADGLLNNDLQFILNALTTDTTYDLEITVVDADGVDTSTLAMPWTGSLTLSSWVDTPLLHNALRFACSEIGYADEASCTGAGGTWVLGRKWANGWGLPDAQYPGAEYGSFNCSTCHTKDSTNIKRVIPAVNASSGILPGSTVTYQTTTEGTSDFGDDSDNHTTSDRVCEVCHSKTQYHRYDTSAQVNFNHNNNADCIRCHEHKVGFRASCDSCHATPPVSTAGLVTSDPTGATGTDYGEHQVHAVDFGFDCKTCHNGWDEANQMPNTGNVNIGYKPSVNPRFASAANNVDGGTFDGRVAGAYTADATTSTNVTNGGNRTCAVYCHGYATPSWDPIETTVCGACHGAPNTGVGDRSGAPTGIGASKDLSGSLTGFKIGKHATHIDDSIFQTGDPCALCHDGFGYGLSTHVDGTVNVKLKQNTQSLTPTTTGGAGTSAMFTPGVPGVSPGSCDNMDCHGYTPWDSAAVLTCTQACHGYPPTTTTGFSNYTLFDLTSHDTPNGVDYLKANHGQCKYCHGWNDDGDGNLPISGMTVAELTAMQGDPAEAPNFTQYDSLTNTNGLHGNGTITMNYNGDGNEANDAGYDPATGGCNNAVCHGNDAAHQFNVAGNTNTKVPADIGPGDCGACHTSGVGGATIVTSSSPHTTVTRGGAFTSCGACHSGHYTKAGGVQIPNNANVGISYNGTQHGGIKLGGPGTDASISGKTTEAEICWGCHNLAANSISEWGTNAQQAGSPVVSQYNYGSLSGNAASGGWYAVTTPGSESGATWTSGKTAFSYKTGKIQSTHSVNTSGTSVVSGANYAKTEAIDAVANIRCSYCHDVHDAVGPNGPPYLRGTWWGNPYEEDGAPQSGQTYVNLAEYGAVPRGGQNTTNRAERLGGFWIDINNVRPGTASTTADGTPYYNPTASGGTGTGGAWTLSDSASLCTLCHGNNVDTMDVAAGQGNGGNEGLWLGTNGHSNAVIGGNGTSRANLFELRGANTGTNTNPAMHFKGAVEPGDSGTKTSYRNGGTSTRNYRPCINTCGSESTRPYSVELWGTMSYNTTTADLQYHKFSCSKCHNPHASRLPKLMITNCLDTKHNTWDDAYQLNTDNANSINYNRSLSNWSTSQNCHRVGAVIPGNRVIPGTGGTYPEPVDTGAVGAPQGTGNDYQNRGWNYVTPW